MTHNSTDTDRPECFKNFSHRTLAHLQNRTSRYTTQVLQKSQFFNAINDTYNP